MKLQKLIGETFDKYFKLWKERNSPKFKTKCWEEIRNKRCEFCDEYDHACGSCPINLINPKICYNICSEFINYPDETMFKICKILDRLEEEYNLEPHNWRKWFLKIKNK